MSKEDDSFGHLIVPTMKFKGRKPNDLLKLILSGPKPRLKKGRLRSINNRYDSCVKITSVRVLGLSGIIFLNIQ
jgi:hypothetical protein